MGYSIEQLTHKERLKVAKRHPNARVKLVEQGFKPVVLGVFDTAREAGIKRAWREAVDELNDEIGDFRDNMLEKFWGRLCEAEIKEQIKEYS